MPEHASNHAPLIPMSEMFATSTAASEVPKDTRQPVEQQQPPSKKGSLSYSLELIDLELTNLTNIQSTNNEEIKKRLTDIQSLRENNLVVVGAIGGLKKIREKL